MWDWMDKETPGADAANAVCIFHATMQLPCRGRLDLLAIDCTWEAEERSLAGYGQSAETGHKAEIWARPGVYAAACMKP